MTKASQAFFFNFTHSSHSLNTLRRMLLKSVVTVALALGATANVQTGKVDPAPPGYEE